MKRSIVFLLFLLLSVPAFTQQTDPPQLSVKESYLLKSKHQKTAAFVLLAGGAALAGGGFLVGNSKEASFDDAGTGIVMAGVGVLSMLGSIPLFIASTKNKNRAMKVSASINMEQAFFAQGVIMTRYPALQITLKL
jgi:hypothetical protein